MKTIDKVADIVSRQGVAITMSIIVMVLAWIFVRSILKQYEAQKKLDRDNFQAEKEIERQERKEDRQAQREQTKSLIDLHSQTNEALTKFTEALKFSDLNLAEHNQKSLENFNCLNLKFDNIDKRLDNLDNGLDIVQNQVSDLATKAMLEEIKKNVDFLRQDLKKD